MDKRTFVNILNQLNKNVPPHHSLSTEFGGGITIDRVRVNGINEPVVALIYNRKVFGIADAFTIYIDKDSCNESKRIAFTLKKTCYYHEIVEL